MFGFELGRRLRCLAWRRVVLEVKRYGVGRLSAGRGQQLRQARLAGLRSRARLVGRQVNFHRLVCDNAGRALQPHQSEEVQGHVAHVTQPGCVRDWVKGAGGEIEIALADENVARVLPIVRGGVNLFDTACVCAVSGAATCRFHCKCVPGAVPDYVFH